jgi:hypothetical protein
MLVGNDLANRERALPRLGSRVRIPSPAPSFPLLARHLFKIVIVAVAWPVRWGSRGGGSSP